MLLGVMYALKAILSWGIFGFGMLHAYFPINDQETSTAHRAITLTVTAGVLFWLWA